MHNLVCAMQLVPILRIITKYRCPSDNKRMQSSILFNSSKFRSPPRSFTSRVRLPLEPCSDGVWLDRSKFGLVDCDRWNSISHEVPTARGLANLSTALE
ncbi:hypothetical protein AVEN_269430-1 [Araneus ventricosus]|uniref:Uncharacterized protein n=1 Tax=Araneus ventricosus TaxID=182803 RepID=A0A4Y2A6T0_ARAVE|nr:hypothetical protein AVEN_269430-1 [Araneus ventricosus]